MRQYKEINKLIKKLNKNCEYKVELLSNARLTEYMKRYNTEYFRKYSGLKKSTSYYRKLIQRNIDSYGPSELWPARILFINRANNKMVANFTVANVEDHVGCGYYVSPEYSGNGIATWMLGVMTNEIKTWDIGHILLDIYVDNEASIRVAEKCGYKYLHQLDNEDGVDTYCHQAAKSLTGVINFDTMLNGEMTRIHAEYFGEVLGLPIFSSTSLDSAVGSVILTDNKYGYNYGVMIVNERYSGSTDELKNKIIEEAVRVLYKTKYNIDVSDATIREKVVNSSIVSEALSNYRIIGCRKAETDEEAC